MGVLEVDKFSKEDPVIECPLGWWAVGFLLGILMAQMLACAGDMLT